MVGVCAPTFWLQFPRAWCFENAAAVLLGVPLVAMIVRSGGRRTSEGFSRSKKSTYGRETRRLALRHMSPYSKRRGQRDGRRLG